MNCCIIDNINAVAKPEDDIIFLGDFAFSKSVHRIVELRKRIKCNNFYFIFGNHDKLIRKNQDFLKHQGFRIWGDYAEEDFLISDGKKKSVTLTHYSFKIWNKRHYGSWNLYGHSHGSLPDDPNSLSFDVGVDTNNFKPYSLKDVESIMANKTFKPIDRHEKRIR